MSKLGELVELCHELSGEDFSAHFSYSGHVNNFSLYVHLGGRGGKKWSPDYFDCSASIDEAQSAIDWLKEKHAENKLLQAERTKNKEQNAKALEEAKALLTPEQIKIIKELA